MDEQMELIIEEQAYEENTGVVMTDVNEVAPRDKETTEDVQLLEQINHKLDLLLSLGGKE